MRRILVSGASGIVGYGILRALLKSEKALFLVGTSIYEDSVAPAFCHAFAKAPRTDEPGYLDWLLSTIRRHGVEMLVPGIEIDMYKWAEHVSEIEEVGSMPLLNTPELVAACKDKWTFYEKLKSSGMRCVIDSSLDRDFDALRERFGLPFLLKPRRGFGSKGLVRVDSLETFMSHRQNIGEVLMSQPIVGSDDEEYTTSAFCDGAGGYFAVMTLKRLLSRDGFTEKAEVVSTGEFAETILELCRCFRPFGPTNFQFRRCADGLRLLEINPRISSSTSIRTAFGYNESAMAVDYFLEHQIPSQPVIRRGRAVRYVDERVFYEDGVYL